MSEVKLYPAEGNGVHIRSAIALASRVEEYNPGNIRIERLLDAESTAISQEPTGLGTSNAIVAEFGSGSGGPTEPYTLTSTGLLTINEAGLYRIKVSFQFGRLGNPGTSELLFRAVVNGVQVGRSIAVKITAVDDEQYIENDNWVNLPAGVQIQYELMRDTAGHDSGGLYMITPSDEGTSTWNAAPTASIRLERYLTL